MKHILISRDGCVVNKPMTRLLLLSSSPSLESISPIQLRDAVGVVKTRVSGTLQVVSPFAAINHWELIVMYYYVMGLQVECVEMVTRRGQEEVIVTPRSFSTLWRLKSISKSQAAN